MRIVAPARAWVYRSSFETGTKLIPNDDISTTLIIVEIVTTAKVVVTSIRFQREPWAAGYIRIGISGSHGPKTKIVNNIHGVRFLLLFFPSAWT